MPRRPNRPITSAAVSRARRTDRIAIATPGDFVTAQAGAIDRSQLAGETLLPYCLDFLRQRSVYVAGVGTAAAQAAPFYYLHLRRHAQRVVSAPWEALPFALQPQLAPVFLFSPGRCGSTLLSRLLSAAGCANVSEPDFYTQATGIFAAGPLNPWRAPMTRAVAAMGVDLAQALDPTQALIVKLRAESCRAPELLVPDPDRRTIFMTRGFEAWARSNQRAFRNGARKAVGKYLRAMTCEAWLKKNSRCHVLRYEDLQSDPLGTAAALGRFLWRDIPPAVVEATMKEDSQEGTPLEQGARGDVPGWERRLDETMALWNSAKVRRIRDRLGAA